MAAAEPKSVKEALQEELTCSICLEVLADPVMIVGCGHNFCRLCLGRYWAGALRNVSCPQCRTAFPKARLEENRQLRNVAEVARRMASLRPKEGPLCALHQEPLKLFCQNEGRPICVVCDKRKAHRGHCVIPLEEAHQALQNKIVYHLTSLKKTRGDAEKFKEEAKKSMKDMEIGIVKDKLLADVEEFCQFLKHQVQLLLPHLDVFQADLTKKVDETSSRYSMEIDQLNSLISDIEKTSNQPAIDLLKERAQVESMIFKGQIMCRQFMRKDIHGIRDLYSETERFEANRFDFLKERHSRFIEHKKTVQDILKRFKGEMAAALRRARGDVLKPCVNELGEDSLMIQDRPTPFVEAMMYFDAVTAHNQLILSWGGRSVRVNQGSAEIKTFHKMRFDQVKCVLGTLAFMEGRHCWEIDIKDAEYWGVGVAKESVKRKTQVDPVEFSPKDGIWAIGCCNGKYAAFTYAAFTGCIDENPLSLCEPLKKIKVYLDYMAGEVSFRNSDTDTLIFVFPPAAFGREPIRPWFWLDNGQMSLPWPGEQYPVGGCQAF
ncbi:zinc finger protein RFP isoform X2 [Anolis carolinensis]|uniref:zinc finger protein RFP isoform X2 n=1 Tax=Anolis carolinensis TaxID=28377 RepID=UPI002F2B1E83